MLKGNQLFSKSTGDKIKSGLKLPERCALTQHRQIALFMCRLADVQLDNKKCFLSNRMYCLVGITEFPSNKTFLNHVELVIDVALGQGEKFNGLFW